MTFAQPSPGRITQEYSPSHRGRDYGHGNGLQVYAAQSGNIVAAREVYGYGNRIVIDHGNGISTRYAHLSSMLVSPGGIAGRGQRIGSEGSTGSYASGVHLHFEVLVNGVKVNPAPYFSSSAGGGVTPIPPEEDDMTPAQAQSLAEVQTSVVEIQRAIRLLTNASIAQQVWSTNVRRGDGISVLQDQTDGVSNTIKILAALESISTRLDNLEARTTGTPAAPFDATITIKD